MLLLRPVKPDNRPNKLARRPCKPAKLPSKPAKPPSKLERRLSKLVKLLPRLVRRPLPLPRLLNRPRTLLKMPSKRLASDSRKLRTILPRSSPSLASPLVSCGGWTESSTSKRSTCPRPREEFASRLLFHHTPFLSVLFLVAH